MEIKFKCVKVYLPLVHLMFLSCVYFARDWRALTTSLGCLWWATEREEQHAFIRVNTLSDIFCVLLLYTVKDVSLITLIEISQINENLVFLSNPIRKKLEASGNSFYKQCQFPRVDFYHPLFMRVIFL